MQNYVMNVNCKAEQYPCHSIIVNNTINKHKRYTDQRGSAARTMLAIVYKCERIFYKHKLSSPVL